MRKGNIVKCKYDGSYGIVINKVMKCRVDGRQLILISILIGCKIISLIAKAAYRDFEVIDAGR